MAARQLRLTFPRNDVPPDWLPPAVVPYEGSWWSVEQVYLDTQGATGTHVDLVESLPAPKLFIGFEKDEAPPWKVGQVGQDPRGTDFLITELRRTGTRLSFIGVPVPPPDSVELRSKLRA